MYQTQPTIDPVSLDPLDIWDGYNGFTTSRRPSTIPYPDPSQQEVMKRMTIDLVAPSQSLPLVVRELLELVPGMRITFLGESSDGAEDRDTFSGSSDSDAGSSPAIPALLSIREREILALVAEGHQNLEIAHKLGISCRTVEFHRTNIKRKIGARNTADLVRYAISCDQK